MVDVSDVRRLAMSLPDTIEDEAGTHFHVNGTGFAWPYRARVHPQRARLERLDIFVMRVANEDDKQAMLAGEPGMFFTTDHYDGYPAVLVRLDAITIEELRALLSDAHEAARQQRRRSRDVQR